MPLRDELAIRPRRRDGFSDDGLSYSVADDYSKQMGQALVDYEARTAHPRFVPGARVENPDAPDILKRELFDPITTAFTGGGRNGNEKYYHVGNELLRTDQLGGGVHSVYKTPEKQKDMSKADEMALGNALKIKAAIAGKAVPFESDKPLLADAEATIKRLYTDKNTPVAPVVAPTPQMAIGDLSQELRPVQQSIVKPGQIGPKDSDIAYLKANPSKAAAFEKRFGVGSSKQHIK